eukprot:sb/3468953/
MDKLKEIITGIPAVQFICLDVANGYSEHFVEFVKKVRTLYPTKTIIAGNVVTGEMVEELILAGADLVKVGIGPGSVCTTRVLSLFLTPSSPSLPTSTIPGRRRVLGIPSSVLYWSVPLPIPSPHLTQLVSHSHRKKTGVGYPQLSAVLECADAAHGLGGHIIADGGCTCPGDIAKAFGAGADFVMLGGMFAGHDEGDGEIIEKDGQKYVKFYGMSSSTAMQKHVGGVANYRTSEGKTVLLPYK